MIPVSIEETSCFRTFKSPLGNPWPRSHHEFQSISRPLFVHESRACGIRTEDSDVGVQLDALLDIEYLHSPIVCRGSDQILMNI